ncbi:hypothetical protein ABKV76_22570 (plasmid) [Enterobacter hormaechei]
MALITSKDGKIWIFDIVALKQKLGVSSNEELEAQGKVRISGEILLS